MQRKVKLGCKGGWFRSLETAQYIVLVQVVKMIQLFVVAGLSKCGYVKAHYRQTDRQTHSDRGIESVLGRLVHFWGN